MEGTRLRIVAILQHTQQATVEEFARALDLAPASIRRHLDILQRDRLVAYHAIRQKPGRPQHAFYLTEEGQEALPRRYQQLLQRLLQIWDQREGAAPGSFPGAGLDLLFARLAGQISEPYVARFQDQPTSERVAALEEILEVEQFAPSTETLPSSLRIHLLNCPFRSVAMDNAAICALDQGLISRVLGAPAVSEQRINREGHHCIYTIDLGR